MTPHRKKLDQFRLGVIVADALLSLQKNSLNEVRAKANSITSEAIF